MCCPRHAAGPPGSTGPGLRPFLHPGRHPPVCSRHIQQQLQEPTPVWLEVTQMVSHVFWQLKSSPAEGRGVVLVHIYTHIHTQRRLQPSHSTSKAGAERGCWALLPFLTTLSSPLLPEASKEPAADLSSFQTSFCMVSRMISFL